MIRMSTSFAAISLVATLGLASAAEAQSYSNIGSFVSFPGSNRGRNVSVLQRERPEYAVQGLRAGAFLIFPKATLTLGTIDNVFATDTNEQSDSYFDFSPSAAIESDWSRHSIKFNAGLSDRRYSDYSAENYTNWRVDTSGRFDVVGDSYVSGGAEMKRDHITREQISFPANAAEPVSTTTTDAFLRGVYQGGRVRMLGNIVAANVDFDDVNSIAGGRVDQDGRDFDNLALLARADFALSPDTAIFGEVKRTKYSYDAPAGGRKRDSVQTEGLVGANFDVTSLLRGEIGVGYLRREYDDAAFNKISGLAVRGEIEYFPTQLTTITLNARRSVEDSILANAGGYLSTYGSLRVDHELLRNLLLNAQIGYEKAEFRGADRRDEVLDYSIGANFLVNRYVGVGGGFSHRGRDSSGAARGPSFDLNKFAVTLTIQR